MWLNYVQHWIAVTVFKTINLDEHPLKMKNMEYLADVHLPVFGDPNNVPSYLPTRSGECVIPHIL